MPAPSLAQIGEHLGVSKTRAAELKLKGMPTNSLRAAMLWREKQPLRRAPVNGPRKGDSTKVLKTANLQSAKRGRPKTLPKLAKTGDVLGDILTNSRITAEAAFQEYHAAETQNQAVLLSNHTKASEALVKIERMVREEQERRGVLVNKQHILDGARRAIEAMTKRLKKLPQEIGPQINEQEPLRAVTILQRAVDEIMDSGKEALRGL